MSRLILAVASVLLVFAPPARADGVTVALPVGVLTSDPAIAIQVQPAGTAMQCRLTGDAFAPCGSPWKPTVGADGVYTYDVLVSGYTFGGSFTLDRTPPLLAFTDGPADGSSQLSRDATFKFVSSDAHADRIECTESDYVIPCTDTFALPLLPFGAHTVTVRAYDKAGNVSEITRSFTVVRPTLIVDPGPKATPAPQGGVLSASASKPSASLTAKRTRGWTRLNSLTVRDVLAGTAIKATCKGKGGGCPKRALRVTATKDGAVALTGLTGRRLRPGTVIAITLTRRGAPAQTIRILIRSLSAPRID